MLETKIPPFPPFVNAFILFVTILWAVPLISTFPVQSMKCTVSNKLVNADINHTVDMLSVMKGVSFSEIIRFSAS